VGWMVPWLSHVCPANLFLLNIIAKSVIGIMARFEKLKSMQIVPLRLAQVPEISIPLPWATCSNVCYKLTQ